MRFDKMVSLDVTDDTSVQQAIDSVLQKSGRLDVVMLENN
jgi:NAD(P)-dependent dehydrogenase (short-subunit alcohol dehydrogenase family)